MKMLIRILIAPVVSLLLLPSVALSQESGEMSREERRAAWEAMTPEERNAKRTEMRDTRDVKRAEMRARIEAMTLSFVASAFTYA